MAGMPKARVFPLCQASRYNNVQNYKTYLPVSAIPTTSFPLSAGGHVHACIGVGSLNPVKAPRRPSGMFSWSNAVTGTTASPCVWLLMVMLCFLRKVSASAGEHCLIEGSEDGEGCWEVTVVSAGVGSDSRSRSCFCFFFFLEGLGLSVESSNGSCAASRLRFLWPFELRISSSSAKNVSICERTKRTLNSPGLESTSPVASTELLEFLCFFFLSFLESERCYVIHLSGQRNDTYPTVYQRPSQPQSPQC